MRQQDLLQSINELLAWQVAQVMLDTEIGLTDKNRLIENLLIPVFREVYGWKGLVNLNTASRDFPAIDLGDETARVAIQVTSTSSSRKVRDTLRKFVSHELYQQYDHLIIYIIAHKQRSYSSQQMDSVVGGRFRFKVDEDVRDCRDLYRIISQLGVDRIARVEQILAHYVGPQPGREREVDPKEIKEAIARHSKNALAREKNQKRYIPSIYAEVARIKDRARYFAHPVLFLDRVTERIRRLELSRINRLLHRISVSPVELALPTGTVAPGDIGEIGRHSALLNQSLVELSASVERFRDYSRTAPPVGIPAGKLYIYEEIKYPLGMASESLLWVIRECMDDLKAIRCRVFFIVGRAGQGKTSFVCDFAENALLTRGIPCLFFTGDELNLVAPDQVGEHIVSTALGQTSNVDVREGLAKLERLCMAEDAPLTIIIDGLNDHSDIPTFAHRLEKFIEGALDFNHIKFVLTCRAEYFDERFDRFHHASFADKIYFIKDFERGISSLHRDDMVHAYLRFFRLQPAGISSHVLKFLGDDTLLLRFFCEAYGDDNANQPIALPDVLDVCKDKVFRLYLCKKLRAASRRYDASSVPVPGRPINYQRALRQIVCLMLEQKQFANIPVAHLDTEYHKVLGNC